MKEAIYDFIANVIIGIFCLIILIAMWKSIIFIIMDASSIGIFIVSLAWVLLASFILSFNKKIKRKIK